jgi:hypothetical protein
VESQEQTDTAASEGVAHCQLASIVHVLLHPSAGERGWGQDLVLHYPTLLPFTLCLRLHAS